MPQGELPRPVPLFMAGLLLAALGGIELWLTLRAGGTPSVAGLAAGAALLALLLVVTSMMSRQPRGWVTAAAAALLSLGELVLGAVVVGIVVAATAVALPSSVGELLLSSQAAINLVVLGFLALALWVAARSWWRHAARIADATRAELETVRARAELAERDRQLAHSELLLLRAQVEPHFLWNTLGHVQHLVRRNPADADRLTGHLIRYLRMAVPQIRKPMSTVKAEFASAQAYLELMKIRMGDRLTVAVHLPPDLEQAPLAPLLVQTLVENAIKHGVEPKVGPVTVAISAAADSDRFLCLEVRDNGVGLRGQNGSQGTGLGLRNVRERLRLLYGDEASLMVAEAPAGGVVARIRTPRGAGPAEGTHA